MLLGFAVAILAGRASMPFLSERLPGRRGPWGVLLGAAAVCLLGVADDLWQPRRRHQARRARRSRAGLMAWKGVQLVSLPDRRA